MRSYLPDFELHAASSLDEALRMMAAEPGAWRPFAGGTDLMVLLEAGQARGRPLPEPAALRRAPRHLDRRPGDCHRRADDVLGRDAIGGAAVRVSAAVPRRRRYRRRCDPESRHDRRKHRQCLAGGRYAAGASRLRRQRRPRLGPRHAPRSLRSLSSRLQADGPRARRADSFSAGRSRPRQLAAGMAQGRHAPGAGDLESLRRRGPSILPAAPSPTSGSRSAAWRRRWSAPRTRKRRCADGR